MDTKQFEKLIPGERYTFSGLTEFGFPYSQHVKLVSLEIKPYAQYRESVTIYYIQKGKRKTQGKIVLPHNSLIVWEGWQDVKTNMYVDNSGISLACFDKKYMDIALNSVNISPIIKQF